MSSQSLAGRKRRISDETEPQTPVRRRRVSTSRVKQQSAAVKQVLKRQGDENQKDVKIILSSPTDVSDAAVLQQTRQVRTKLAKASGLPNLSLSPPEPIVTKVAQVAKDEETLQLEEEVEALTPRPTVIRRTAPRPPLSRRRAVELNRARFGVGIVRCRNWKLNEEETETEDESPAPSPRSSRSRSKTPISPIEFSSYGCLEDGNNVADGKSEHRFGILVLPIDPSAMCFDRSYSEDQWQLRSPSPDEEFVPENSCCAGMSVEKTVNDQERCGSETCKPKPILAHVESNWKKK